MQICVPCRVNRHSPWPRLPRRAGCSSTPHLAHAVVSGVSLVLFILIALLLNMAEVGRWCACRHVSVTGWEHTPRCACSQPTCTPPVACPHAPCPPVDLDRCRHSTTQAMTAPRLPSSPCTPQAAYLHCTTYRFVQVPSRPAACNLAVAGGGEPHQPSAHGSGAQRGGGGGVRHQGALRGAGAPGRREVLEAPCAQ